MQDALKMFAVALGFEVDTASRTTAIKSIADYEKAVKEAEKRIEDAKWAGAKSDEEIAKLTRETHLKEARAALASAQEREKAEKELARKRADRSKEFMEGFNRLSLAAAAAATAIGYAVSKVASAFDNLGFASQRTGASVQSLNSLGYAFKQTGGSAQQAIGAVEKFAQAMRGNPGLKGFVQGLGVDTSKDMGDQYLDTVAALSKQPYYVGSQQAGMLGISEEDYKQVSDHLQQIRDYREEYNRTTRSLGVDSQKATEASQSFWRSLNKLQATASALTDKLMISLAPAIEAIVRRINDWIAANPEKVEKIMRGIGEATDAVTTGLTKLADWFGNDENQRAIGEFWEKFNKYVSDSVKSITELLKLADKLDKFFGLKPGDDPIGVLATRALGNQQQVAPGDTSAGKTYTPLLQRGLNAVKRRLGIGGEDMTPTPGDRTSIAGRTFASKAPGVMKRLMADFNLSKDEAAIVAGNIGHESAGFTAFEEGGNGPGRGWAQWTDPGRKRRFYKYAQDNNLDIKSDEANYGFLKWELEHTHKSSIDDLKNARSYQDKMIAFEASFEGAGEKRYGSRFGYAQRAREAYDRAERSAVARATPTAALPNMTPGGFDPNAVSSGSTPSPAGGAARPRLGSFDPNNIDPANLMRPAPASASPTTNNTSSSRSVTQHIQSTTHITGSDRPKEAARVMESAFERMHGLALANAQSAVV
jgi:hypothetical protein